MIYFIKRLFSKKQEDCFFRSQGVVVEKQLLLAHFIGMIEFDKEDKNPVPYDCIDESAKRRCIQKLRDYYFECVWLINSDSIKNRKDGNVLLNKITACRDVCFCLIKPFGNNMNSVVVDKICDEFYIEWNHICTIKFSEIDQNPVTSHYESINPIA